MRIHELCQDCFNQQSGILSDAEECGISETHNGDTENEKCPELPDFFYWKNPGVPGKDFERARNEGTSSAVIQLLNQFARLHPEFIVFLRLESVIVNIANHRNIFTLLFQPRPLPVELSFRHQIDCGKGENRNRQSIISMAPATNRTC